MRLTRLTFVPLVLVACSYEHRRPIGPIAQFAESLRASPASLACETRQDDMEPGPVYRTCMTRDRTAAYSVGKDGTILSGELFWTLDSIGGRRLESQVASLDARYSRLKQGNDGVVALTIIWPAGPICHVIWSDTSERQVYYGRVLLDTRGRC